MERAKPYARLHYSSWCIRSPLPADMEPDRALPPRSLLGDDGVLNPTVRVVPGAAAALVVFHAESLIPEDHDEPDEPIQTPSGSAENLDWERKPLRSRRL
eukprot:1129598-Alexandrium_andersonii.AAC.1